MKFFIFPLLIAAYNQMQSEYESSTKTPEVTYNVTYNVKFTSSKKVHPSFPQAYSYHATSQMKCQYDNPLYLSCHQENAGLNVTYFYENPENDHSNIYNTSSLIDLFGDVRFDIKLNKTGVKDIFVPQDMNDRNFDELRIVVNTLHTGIKPGTESKALDLTETFLNGDCVTHYEVSGFTKHKVEDNVKQHISLKGTPVVIDKTRNHDSTCYARVWQAYPSRAMKKRIDINFSTSEAHMKATENSFESTIAFEAESPLVTRRGLPLSLLIKGDVEIVFDSAAPAEHKFDAIENPKSLGLVIGDF